MTEDEKFETFLEREARGFNEPPAEVPHEEMWAAIAAARRRRPLGFTRRFTPWIGMAATLLIGLGIGRYMIARELGTVPGVDSLAVAASRVTTVGAAASGAGEAGDAGDAGANATRMAPQVEPVASPRLAATRLASATRPATRPVAGSPDAPAPDAPARRDGGSATYSIASQQHLTRAEALVAVVSAMPADAALDSLTGRWARDVLTNTRLLLDSPAGDDPARRRLLEDLETVLVQLVQRSGRTAEDRAMIDRTLQKTQILTRLRSGATGT